LGGRLHVPKSAFTEKVYFFQNHFCTSAYDTWACFLVYCFDK
jgi:hypothetical protein